MDRRKFLSRLSLGLSGCIAFIISIPVIGSLLAPLIVEEPREWRDVGASDDFEVGEMVLVKFRSSDHHEWSGEAAMQAAWLRRDSKNRFTAFSVNCTHLGCPVRWQKDPKMFFCPCHGGVYHEDGTVAAGPPPRELQRYPARKKGDRVEVMSSPVPITNLTA